MGSPYAGGSSSRGSAYARGSSSGGSAYAGGSSGAAPAEKKSGHGLGHILTQTAADFENAAVHSPAQMAKLVADVGRDVADIPKNSGRGIAAGFNHGAGGPVAEPFSRTRKDAALTEKATLETIKHPLRHPGDTILLGASLFSGGASGTLRLTGALKAGETGAAVKALTTKPTLGERTLKVGRTEAKGHYSRSTGAAVIQKGADTVLQKAATKSSRAENILHRRAAKWNERALSVEEAKARSVGTMLQAAGRKLTPAEQRALRLVAEEVPVGRRLGAQELRAAQAKHPKEAARHQKRITLTRDAMQFLDNGSDGKPVFKPEATKLARVYDLLKKASGDRESMLKNLGLMDQEAAQAAKTNAARFAVGAKYVKPTASRLGNPTAAFKRAQGHVTSLEGRLTRHDKFRTPAEAQKRLDLLERAHTKAVDEVAAGMFGPATPSEVRFRTRENERARRQQAGRTREGKLSGASGFKSKLRPTVVEERRRLAEKAVLDAVEKNPKHPTSVRWMQRVDEIDQLKAALNPELFEKVKRRELGRQPGSGDPARRQLLEGALQIAREDLTRTEKAAGSRVKPTGVVGAEDVTVSPAPFVGSPVERNRITGRAKVSSTSTFGHTPKPGSLKTNTGASVRHALERNDTTQIVAERHAEAVRLSQIHRRVDLVKKAGTKTPRRNDDVWVWTDKTVSKERIPAEVRRHLDNPEGLTRLAEHQQETILDQIKNAVMERHDWHGDPEQLANFEKYAAEGKGVFVPRRLLGNAGKRSPNISAIRGVGFVDAVNNAQKAGLVYLKLSYPVVQAFSNTAMNVIHQGFAAPTRLTQAIRLEHKIGPEGAAVVDDIMGQGAVLQAAFHGQGMVAHMSQGVARVMSSKVDTPARRAAFLHEAIKAGADTSEKLLQLLTDDAQTAKLVEVSQRAKEAIVDYGEMSPTERQLIRRLIFVYPWQKGAVKYAGHFVRDHPVQAAALGLLGTQGKEISDTTLGAVPSYSLGAFKVGGGLVQPSGVNFLQTPAQIGRAGAGFLTGNPAAAMGQDFLSPGPATIVALATGRDSLGRALKGSLPARLRHLTVEQTPIAALARAAAAGHEGLGGDITRTMFGSHTSSATYPNANDAYWRFLLGGLYPRDFSKPALNKNAALEKAGR